jgi:hypothetical protein
MLMIALRDERMARRSKEQTRLQALAACSAYGRFASDRRVLWRGCLPTKCWMRAGVRPSYPTPFLLLRRCHGAASAAGETHAHST